VICVFVLLPKLVAAQQGGRVVGAVKPSNPSFHGKVETGIQEVMNVLKSVDSDNSDPQSVLK